MLKSYTNEVHEYVLSLLTTRTPVENFYHDTTHTKEVVQSAVEIGKGENLSEEGLEVIQIAAWFHDVGYIERSNGHEKISENYARKYLSSINYPSGKTQKVMECIRATKIPQMPKNKFERVLCDADLNHLGRETFFDRNEKYRVEFENHLGKKLTEIEWLKKTIDFVKRHRFFTNYALKNFSAQKKENLGILQDQLQQLLKHTS